MSIELIPIRLTPFISKVDLLQKYYSEYYGSAFIDHSMAIMRNEQPIGYICASQLKDVVSQIGCGLEIIVPKTEDLLTPTDYKKILELLTDHARKYNCSIIEIKDNLQLGKLSSLGEVLFNERFQSKLTFEMIIDYKDFSETTYYASIRKSYKSLINWGRKNLQINYINIDNPDWDAFKAFQSFHKKIAGRITRSDASWERQFDMIKNGVGELILAYYENKLVAGSLFTDQLEYSVYFTGVYERELFQYGVSHYLLYLGIIRSYQRNQSKLFSLGNFDTDIEDPKLYNIQFFKKGFVAHLIPTIIWTKKIMIDQRT